MFPQTTEEFDNLLSDGKTVLYAETEGEGTPPFEEGEWHFWSMREGETETKAVWRRIADL